ncbi:SUMF1/EgtB/PvdO family nonheme iron enzyme [Marinobacter sp. CHS3-4]|uniref:formylglycine-generating enzyme family protein n=1 Tax=Marinobacter sp. CHS3-4 TaxID=3045174 RepID=UPI0024B606A1|nr:SUMF1/EgtB/PvdO family nonheme iron enzyme [Marinobacter sp. CHS3-4]MDI9246713.1 SUMF1/EgtB/PvdO family nonheme iron enzyme [Marinobacter sp. CHS3-4]
MQPAQIRRFCLASAIAIFTTGCGPYYDYRAEGMVERQMDAMVFVEGGEFMMGNPGGWSVRSDTLPVHRVVLDDFHIQKYEVTQGDFELFQAATGYEHSYQFYDKKRDENPDRYDSELPAVASWIDAMAFCQWLGDMSGKPVTLPTEAQWEYAARARGKIIRYATENGEAEEGITMAAGPTPRAWQGRPYDEMLPNPPGSFPPNSIGLYDMSGNVAEWVNDYYSESYYKDSPVHNPKGPQEGIKTVIGTNPDVYRVLRGGEYRDFIGNTTVTRRKEIQNGSNGITGFRCAY